MCAMMPKFRTLLRSVSTSFCATEVFPLSIAQLLSLRPPASPPGLSPAIVREGAVCLGHFVGVLTPLDGGPEAVAGIQDLVCQPLDHRLLPALPREADKPAQRQGGGPVRTHLDGHLVGRTTDAAAAHLQGGLDVVESTLEGDHGIGTSLFPGVLKRSINNALGERFLPFEQDLV